MTNLTIKDYFKLYISRTEWGTQIPSSNILDLDKILSYSVLFRKKFSFYISLDNRKLPNKKAAMAWLSFLRQVRPFEA